MATAPHVERGRDAGHAQPHLVPAVVWPVRNRLRKGPGTTPGRHLPALQEKPGPVNPQRAGAFRPPILIKVNNMLVYRCLT